MILAREVGSVGKAVAASVCTGGGIKYSLKRGRWWVKGSCCLTDEGNIKRDGFNGARLAGGIQRGWRRVVVGGLQMMLKGTASRLHSSASALPVGHLVVEEAWERLFCFSA